MERVSDEKKGELEELSKDNVAADCLSRPSRAEKKLTEDQMFLAGQVRKKDWQESRGNTSEVMQSDGEVNTIGTLWSDVSEKKAVWVAEYPKTYRALDVMAMKEKSTDQTEDNEWCSQRGEVEREVNFEKYLASEIGSET